MTRALSVALAYSVIAIAAFWAGTQFAAEDAPTPSPASAPRVIERVAVSPRSSQPDSEEIRDVIRTELDRQGAGDDPEVAPRSGMEAMKIVEAGIRDGTWSASERDALRVELVQLAPAEIDAVLIPLFQAINAQRVRLDGPPI